MKMPVGNTREMPKGVKQCQENIEGYRKRKLIFIFQMMGGCQMPPKQFQQCQKKIRKI
jgi:hypothetical protein